MSVLTGGNQHASCSRVLGVCRYLLLIKKGKAEQRDVLEALLSPNSLRGLNANATGRRDMIANTISECLKMKLLEEEGETLSLRPALLTTSSDPQQWLSRLPVLLADLIFANDNDENHNLARVIAWFLSQDVHRPPMNWAQMAQAIEEQGVSQLLSMNDARLSQFRDWACFLGFAWKCPRGTAEVLVPDPTEQIRLRVNDLFRAEKAASLPLGAAMDRLAGLIPVLEGGVFRNQVEVHRPRREAKHLSSVTAFSLLRLHEEEVIHLHEDADAEMLVLPDGQKHRRFSRVSLGKAK